MSARDLPPGLIPDRHAQACCRARQAMLMIQLVPKLDKLLEEAASARVSAPGLLELREWALVIIEDAADQSAASLRAAA